MHVSALPPSHRRGFTLIELLVVIAIVAVLAAILFPVFAQAREKARQTTCGSNLRQIGFAIAMYRDDYEHYPPIDAGFVPWMEARPGVKGLIEVYTKSEGIRQCPSRKTEAARYTMNGWGTSGQTYFGRTETSPQGQPDAAVPRPSDTLIVWEHQVDAAACIFGQEGGTPEVPNPDAGRDHWDSAHHGGFLTLWCDGRVKRMSYGQLRRRFFTIEEDPE
jgi:prepilin-type N-terminal cleavage/methylation domain-containing protein